MKKCKCGKDIDDRWELCYECNQKEKATKETPNERQASIERQVAVKATSTLLQGHLAHVAENEYTAWFNHILKLIRGD